MTRNEKKIFRPSYAQIAYFMSVTVPRRLQYTAFTRRKISKEIKQDWPRKRLSLIHHVLRYTVNKQGLSKDSSVIVKAGIRRGPENKTS